MDAAEKVNWLAQRWPVEVETYQYGQWLVHVGEVEGQRIAQATSREDFDRWRARAPGLPCQVHLWPGGLASRRRARHGW